MVIEEELKSSSNHDFPPLFEEKRALSANLDASVLAFPDDPSNSLARLVTPCSLVQVESMEGLEGLEAKVDVVVHDDSCAEERDECCGFTPWLLALVLIVVFTIFVVVIAFVVDVTDDDGKDVTNSKKEKSLVVDESFREKYYDTLIRFMREKTLVPTSAQTHSFEWMVFEDVPIDDIDYYRFWQRYSLVVWYFEQGGPTLWSSINTQPGAGWINFGKGVHECDWNGVDCDRDLRVTSLRLGIGTGITLTGTHMSTELGVLTHLNRLDLSNHRLQGSIPEEWQSLTNLDTLILSNNQLRSSIPEWIGNFTKLKTLAVDGNQFTGLPRSLAEVTGLRTLLINNNLGLVDVQLQNFATKLSNLEYLDISMTPIGGTIPETNLRTNYFGMALETFQARRAHLTGYIPTDISRWTNLKKLSVEGVSITGTIPTELGLLTQLETLQLSYMDLMEGTLPTELGLLTNLSILDLTWSNREGTLPVEYSNLSHLVTLHLSHNHHINGTIPSEYGRMTALRHLYLEATGLEGTVWPEVCNLGLDDFETDCSRNKEIECSCCTQCQHNP